MCHSHFFPLPPQAGYPHRLKSGIQRGETYTEAVPGLLFLYRLGRGKTDAPFPRGTGSSEKLKRRDNMSDVQYICLITSQLQEGPSEPFFYFYNRDHFYKEVPERMQDFPKL